MPIITQRSGFLNRLVYFCIKLSANRFNWNNNDTPNDKINDNENEGEDQKDIIIKELIISTIFRIRLVLGGNR